MYRVVEETVTTTTKNLRYSQNNFEDNVPPEQDDQDQQSNYSYKKVIMGSAPKYEKVVEKHVNYEEELGDFDENLKIDNMGNDDGNYTKERQTKITRLPDGGKQIEITEKTQIEVERPPSIRGSRYRYSKNSKNTNEEENNNEDVKSQTRGTYYKVRRPRGNDNNNNNEEKRVSISKVEVEENNDVIIPKRYHRRYRDNKVSTNNDN